MNGNCQNQNGARTTSASSEALRSRTRRAKRSTMPTGPDRETGQYPLMEYEGAYYVVLTTWP